MTTILPGVVHSPSAATLHRVRRLPLLLTAVALVPGLAACGGTKGKTDTKPTTSAAATDTATTTPTETTTTSADSGQTCADVKAPDPRSAEPSLPRPKPATLRGNWTVTMATSCGSFTIRLDTKRQPKTAASFAALTRAKFYNDLTFHRIATGFVIQGGDPLGDGTGGPGYKVHETPPKDAAYTKGVVAMAKSGSEAPGTSGSQFFIVTGADAQLPPEYAIAGKVIKGMDTVERIADVGSSAPPDGPPTKPIVIDKATLSGGAAKRPAAGTKG